MHSCLLPCAYALVCMCLRMFLCVTVCVCVCVYLRMRMRVRVYVGALYIWVIVRACLRKRSYVRMAHECACVYASVRVYVLV
jgi:hypothetical protein